MYPIPQSLIPSMSGFVPRPSSTFRPLAPGALIQDNAAAVGNHTPQGTGSSPGSSILCGQRTPNGSPQSRSSTLQGTPSYNHSPAQNVAPPQPSTPVQHFPSPNNMQPNQPQFTQPCVTPQASPTCQPRQQLPLRTQINPSAKPFIPAPAAPQAVPSTPEQRVLKTVNGEGMKNSRKQENTSSAFSASN